MTNKYAGHRIQGEVYLQSIDIKDNTIDLDGYITIFTPDGTHQNMKVAKFKHDYGLHAFGALREFIEIKERKMGQVKFYDHKGNDTGYRLEHPDIKTDVVCKAASAADFSDNKYTEEKENAGEIQS